MKASLAAAALAATMLTTAAMAESPVHQVIYNVDAVSKCSAIANAQTNSQTDLKDGLAACSIAIRDPMMVHRAALFLDRGVIEARLGDNDTALKDYGGAIALDAKLGDAYVSRAGLLVQMQRYEEARGDVEQGLALGAANLHVAYYSRAVIEEEAGDVQSAYRDYKQALNLKPDFAPAIRELSRFKVVKQSARA
jgi:tetratricopeptide (TPR) repeat protein